MRKKIVSLVERWRCWDAGARELSWAFLTIGLFCIGSVIAGLLGGWVGAAVGSAVSITVGTFVIAFMTGVLDSHPAELWSELSGWAVLPAISGAIFGNLVADGALMELIACAGGVAVGGGALFAAIPAGRAVGSWVARN